MQLQSLTCEQVREIDRRAVEQYGMTGLMLMENAGRGCAEALLRRGCTGKVAIVCGSGNNAGDGFVIARHLDLAGVAVEILLLTQPSKLRGDAATNFGVASASGLPMHDHSVDFDESRFESALSGAAWIVDAVLGTGATGAPRPPWDRAIELMNRAPARRFAVDLPSGMDCDTGAVSVTTFRADVTCTFVAPKAGFANPAAAPYLGEVEVIGIGAPRRLLADYASSAADNGLVQNQVSG